MSQRFSGASESTGTFALKVARILWQCWVKGVEVGSQFNHQPRRSYGYRDQNKIPHPDS